MPTKNGDKTKNEREVENAQELCKLANKVSQLQRDNEALKKRLFAVNLSACSLTSQLCGIATVTEKDGYDLIRRESVMDFITRWRGAWDEAMTPNG
jgi:peroxiredoxin family protein